MGNLQKNFSHSFDGKIWNIESEINGEYLVIEVRNEATLTTLFFLFSASDCRLVDRPITLEETWWVGITYAVGKVIIFHTFSDTENPQHKSFVAWDIERRTVIWKKTDVSFSEYGDTHLKANRNGELLFINIKTGEEGEMEGFVKLTENKELQFPFHYVPNGNHHKTVSRFLDMIGMDSDKQYGIDYLEVTGLVIISYYRNIDQLENRLIVVDARKRVIFNESLGVHLKGIADRPFFVYHDNLIFVKDNTDFFSFQLSQT